MQSRFDSVISSLDLEGRGIKEIVLAVSGGRDSMSMAALFSSSSFIRSEGISLLVAHCNFSLRGEESDGDEFLVSSWCRERGLPFFSRKFDTLSYASSRGVSVEMAARELRYSYFSELCSMEGRALAVAHNSLDNAETLLLNLVRGTGLKGLCGMRPVSRIPLTGEDNPSGGTGKPYLLRPLLSFSREEIDSFVVEKGIPYRDDSTNAELLYKRNRIRHEIIPILKELNPSILATFGREMEYFRELEEVADAFMEDHLSSIVRVPSGSPSLGNLSMEPSFSVDIPSLLSSRAPKYILHRIFSPLGFNSSQTESLWESLVNSSEETLSGKKLASGKGILICTSSSILWRKGETEGNDVDLQLESPGEFRVALPSGRTIILSIEQRRWDKSSSPKTPKGTIYMDEEKVSFPLRLRSWREGDSMAPLGLGGRRKLLSDVFTDLHYSLFDKKDALLLCGRDEEVLSLVGERVSERVKITSSTKSILVFSVK